MNKSTMIAAIFAASAFSAFAADVYSSNIVGYTKLTVDSGTFNMIGVQFQNVGGGSMKINDLFKEPAEGAFVGAPVFTEADQLRVWDPETGGYVQYFFGDWAGVYGAEYDNLWYWESDDANPTEDTLAPGAAVWFLSKSAGTNVLMSVAGEVVSTNYVVTLKGATFNMVANPFPVPLSLSDVTVSGTVDWINSGFTGAPVFTEADQVRVWDPVTGGYKQYFYGNWANAYPGYDNQWYWESDDSTPTTDSIPVGGAAWFLLKGATDVTVTFPAP